MIARKLAEVQAEADRMLSESALLREALVTIRVNAMRRGSDPAVNAYTIDAFEVVAATALRGDAFGPAFNEWQKTHPSPAVGSALVTARDAATEALRELERRASGVDCSFMGPLQWDAFRAAIEQARAVLYGVAVRCEACADCAVHDCNCTPAQ